MHRVGAQRLATPMEDSRAARLDRCRFLASAVRFGLAAPVARSLANLATVAPALALQNAGQTLVVAMPQATVQLTAHPPHHRPIFR
ncbi:MAG: hypothetical protein R2853_06320 [Thermomicrobiales bacterium]